MSNRQDDNPGYPIVPGAVDHIDDEALLVELIEMLESPEFIRKRLGYDHWRVGSIDVLRARLFEVRRRASPEASHTRRFRKKPVEVEAIQWWPPGHVGHVPVIGVERGPRADQPWGVPTLEGFMVANPGDWIITDVKGEKYPCKPDIFKATYEPVDQPKGFWGGLVERVFRPNTVPAKQ